MDKEDDDNKSERSISSAQSKKEGFLHTKNNNMKELMQEKKKPKKKVSILTWPETCLERLSYIFFFPFYLLYWIIMPNILWNPEIIKVLIGILLCFLFFIGFAFVLTKIQEDLIFNFAIKPHLLAVFNAVFYTLSFLIYSISYARANSSSGEVNFFLTIQEMTIFKFTFLVAANGLLYMFQDMQFLTAPKFTTLILGSFAFIILTQLLGAFLNFTGIWTKSCSRIPVALLYILLFIAFIGVNVYL
jgi:hypothetical protein